jgi:hypothetical protein
VTLIQTQTLRFVCERQPSVLPDETARQLLRPTVAKQAIPVLELLPGPYPRLQALLLIDTKAFLESITCIFDEALAMQDDDAHSGDEGATAESVERFMHRPALTVRNELVAVLVVYCLWRGSSCCVLDTTGDFDRTGRSDDPLL